jgi:hypothetical protein
VARLARVVIPGIPHHVTQRGNGRQRTFFEDGDYALYLDLLAAAAESAQTEVWAYCLMPNHVHIVLTPSDEGGLWRTLSYAALRKAENVGRPVGSPEWLTDMEERTALTLRPGKRGPKPKVKRKT